MTKFGIEMRDEAFVVAKRRFEQLVSVDSNLIVKTDQMRETWFTSQKSRRCLRFHS